MQHHKTIKWEKRLRQILDEIDDILEDRYGDRYPLRTNRPKRGTTSSKSSNGLFRIEASYSTGYGSEHGAGYSVDIRILTPEQVPTEVRRAIENQTMALLKQKLPKIFPNNKLQLARSGFHIKIYGDLSLDA